MSTFHFFVFPPSPALAPFIDSIWGVRGTSFFTREAVLPNGVVELMVNFGPTQKVHAYGEQEVDESFHRYWLAGIQDQPLVIGSPNGTDHMGIRFKPGGAHAFFDVPMDAVTNEVHELDLLLGRDACEELRDRLWSRPTDRERAREAERWLLGRRYAVHPYFSTVRRAIDLLQGSGFTLDVPAGETHAIVGPTGAGKSTVVKLLLRLYEPTGGVVRIDDVDIRDLTFPGLRGVLGYVGQDVFLFQGTVRENVAQLLLRHVQQDPEAWQLYGSVLAEIDRMLDELALEHRSRRLMEELDRASAANAERFDRLGRFAGLRRLARGGRRRG